MNVRYPLLALFLSSCAGMNQPGENGIEWVDFGEDPMTSPEFGAAMALAATPSEAHAEMARDVGHYRVEGLSWMAPGADPLPMEATANLELILGGRYLMQSFASDFMGMPYEGVLLMGHDNLSEEYWSLWIDNMSTGYSISSGTLNDEGNVEYSGVMRDIYTPSGRPSRTVMEHHEDGSFTIRMFDSVPGGGEFKVMEMTYSRN